MSDDEPCPALHIVHEIGVYLAGADAPESVQRAAASEALHNGKRAHAALLASQLDPHDVVVYEISIDNGDGPKSVHFAHAPSPIDLLLLVAPNARNGATVQVRQTTAGCGTVTVEERWPFGMDEASEMTIPAIARLHPRPCLGMDPQARTHDEVEDQSGVTRRRSSP